MQQSTFQNWRHDSIFRNAGNESFKLPRLCVVVKISMPVRDTKKARRCRRAP